MQRAIVVIVAGAMMLLSAGSAWAGPPADPGADIRIVGSVGLPQHAGTIQTIGVGVANFGPDVATAVKLRIRLPDEFEYSSTTGPCAPTANNAVVCRFGRVLPSGNEQTTLSLLAVQAGSARLSFTAVSATPDFNLANNHGVWKILVEGSDPIFRVNPSSDLVDLQRVRVRLASVPDDTYVIWECDANFPAHGRDDCLTVGYGTYNASDTAFMRAAVHVHAGPIGDVQYAGSCGTSTTDNNCMITVSPYTNGTPDFTGMPSLPISFTTG